MGWRSEGIVGGERVAMEKGWRSRDGGGCGKAEKNAVAKQNASNEKSHQIWKRRMAQLQRRMSEIIALCAAAVGMAERCLWKGKRNERVETSCLNALCESGGRRESFVL